MSHTPVQYHDDNKQLCRRLEVLERMANVGYFSLDVSADSLFWSDNLYRIFGYTPQDSILLTPEFQNSHFLPEELSDLHTLTQRLLFEHIPYEIVHRFRKKDGSTGTLRTRAERYVDYHGKVYVHGYSEDISDGASLKEQMKHTQELLMQQAKMAEMGRMLSAIAHQLKQPLQVIGLVAGGIEIKCESGCSQEKLHKSITVIQEQLEYMSNTINDFRNYAKPETKMRCFRACECVSDVYKMIAPQLKSDEIELQISEHRHFEVYGYHNDLLNVLMNLFSNAQEAFRSSSVEERRIVADYEMDENFGKIIIRDNAGGIDERLLPDKIFEAYVTTKGDEGTGLGLQIAKTIIEEKMKGKLSAHNTDGGAVFVIELPLAQS